MNLDKPGYFVGRRALEREHARAPPGSSSGLEVDWESLERAYATAGLPPQIPGMAVRGSIPVYSGQQQVGYASTSTWSPVLKKYIALAHLQRPHFEPGTPRRDRGHGRAPPPPGAAAKVVKLPFYDPEWKKK